MDTTNETSTLTHQIVGLGYCIGCGACAVVDHSPVAIELDAYGCYQAVLKPEADLRAVSGLLTVCPFSDESLNEDRLSEIFLADNPFHSPFLGAFQATFAGYVREGDFRQAGSSGGLGKWILAELLRRGDVDAVIQVKARQPDADNPALYAYQVDHTFEQVRAGSKSAYYPVEMSGVLRYVKDHPARYAIVGIPCFIKAVRLLMHSDPVFAERITCCIGLVCGHLKSAHFSDMLAWQVGIAPGDLRAIDFRQKLPGRRANQKGLQVSGAGGQSWLGDTNDLFGSDHNLGFMMYPACNYCDDVVAETADLTIGDAWLPEYIVDGLGTNVIIVRSPALLELLRSAEREERLVLHAIPPEAAIRSQAGGFRQRREGLAYRLHLRAQAGIWHPARRVTPGEGHMRPHRKGVYTMRMAFTEESRRHFVQALAAHDYTVFEQPMRRLVARYQRSDWRRVLIGWRDQLLTGLASVRAGLRTWPRSVIVQNLAGRLGGVVASQGFTAIALLLTARHLGPALYGQYAGAINLLSLAAVLHNLGLNTWLLREGGRRPEGLAASLGSVLAIKLAAGALWLAGAVWLVPRWVDPSELPGAVIAWGALIVLLDSLFQTLVSGLKAALRNWPTFLLEGGTDAAWFGLTLALIAFGLFDLSPYFLVRVLTLVVGGLVGVVYVGRAFGLRPSRPVIGQALADAGPFAASELLTLAAARADVAIVTLLAGSQAAGTYSPAVGLVNMLGLLPVSIYTVMLPVLSGHVARQPQRAQDLARRSMLLYLAGGLALSAAFWLLAPLVVLFLGQRFAEITVLLRILSPILLFRSLSTGFATYLVARGRQKEKAAAQAVAVVAAVVLNLLVIEPYGLRGVAWVYVFSELLLMLGYGLRSGVFARRRTSGPA
jgi:coenzyme F420-reducing hydrogenase beta subunit/O-antigen/teichoic acid export membrane protein